MADMITVGRIVGKKEDLSPVLAYTNANKAPLYMNLTALGRVEPATQTKISWVDYSSEGTQTVLKTKISAAETTSFVVEDGSIFRKGCLAAIGNEVVAVTNISENTLTVTRAQHGTTAGKNYEVGEEIFFINDNIAEGADLQGANYKAGVNYDNNTQIFREEISISGTAEAIQVPSGGGVDAYSLEQTIKRSEEHTSELQSRQYLVCRLLLEKKKNYTQGSGKQQPVDWHALVNTSPIGNTDAPSIGPVRIDVEFNSGMAINDGKTVVEEQQMC